MKCALPSAVALFVLLAPIPAAAQLANLGPQIVLPGDTAAGPAYGTQDSVAMATGADAQGSDPLGLGILLHVDLVGSAFTAILPVVADAQGVATRVQPLPSNPALAGFSFYAQAAFFWVGPCSPSASGFSSSDGLEVTLQP